MNTTHYHAEMDCPLGKLSLRATARGLTGIFMEEHRHGPDEVERAHWQQDDALFAETCQQLTEYFAGTRTLFDLPLDHEAFGGTVFQRRVWTALIDIPYGETISYGELARRIGQPTAVRAVGLANGRNPVSIVIPCHRVVGASGALTGYGGGMVRKRALLDLESSDLGHTLHSPGGQTLLNQSLGTRKKAAQPGHIWLLVLLLYVGRLHAAEPVMPPVVGEGSGQLTTADVNSMTALAQPLVAAELEPVLVATSVSSSKTQVAELERATIYFAPREADARSWRGYCLRCYAAAIHWGDDEPSHWRTAGKWTVPVEQKMDEYIVPAPGGKDLPAWPVHDFAGYRRVELRSKLETGVILGLIDTARGYSMSLPDGTELSFADLPLIEVYANADKKGEITGLVDIAPLRGKVKYSSPIHMRTLFRNKEGWRITKVDQDIYW